jgi:sterol desaturase/sphingolipid hydroxylase (fatty acid hydroxylase superfamily)
MKKAYVSNANESVRMFKNPLLESLSKVPFYIPLIVYIPVVLFFSWKALQDDQMDLQIFLGYLFSGIVLWTLTEYLLHRFVFHFYPASKWGHRIHFIFHGVHHDYPNDAKRLVMPPSASIPLAILFYLLFKSFMGNLAYAVFPGFIIGYLIYDMSHYALHHHNFKTEFWMNLKKHHMLHHYSDSTKGYGVSSDFWDKVFKSNFLKK